MGCWNETCYISHLPICYEEKIVIIPLMRIRTGEIRPHPCEVSDNFMPVGFPIFGEYNDYGGIQNATTSDENKQHLYNMKFYIKNSKDDTYDEVDKDMPFDDFLNKVFCNGEKSYIEVQNNYFFPDNKAPVTFMVMHYEIYEKVLQEIGSRVPYGRNMDFSSVLIKSIQKKYEEIASSNILFVLEKYQLNGNEPDQYTLANRLIRICRLSDEVFGREFHYHKTIWNDLSELVLDYPEHCEKVFREVANLTIFATALSYMRKGFLSHTGRGSQDCETRLHVILADFIKEFVLQKSIENCDGTENGLIDAIYFYD